MAQSHPVTRPRPVKAKRKKWPWVLLASFALVIFLFVSCVNAVGKSIEDAEKPVTVLYEVTGDAKDVSISYTTFTSDGMTSSTESAATLPWTKSMEASGFGKGGSLTVTTGADGGTATCKVVIDGKDAKTGSASGPYALASCNGF